MKISKNDLTIGGCFSKINFFETNCQSLLKIEHFLLENILLSKNGFFDRNYGIYLILMLHNWHFVILLNVQNIKILLE